MEKETPDLAEIMRAVSSKFKIFPLKRSVLENQGVCLIWKPSGDPMDFLAFAEDASARVIYHYKREGEDSSTPEYHELAYIDSGFIHVLCLDLTGNSSSDSMIRGPVEEPLPIMNRKPEDVAVDVADYVMLNLDYMSPDTFNLQYFFRKYWQSMGLDPGLPPGSDLRKFMDRVEELATRKIKSRR